MLNNLTAKYNVQMEIRALGNTGIDVSELSFGTVALGLPYGIGIHGESDMLSDADSISLLRAALSRGLNFYDTALGYGKSENLLGRAFNDCREKVVICTKPTHLYDIYANQSLPPKAEIRAKLDASLQESLSRLQTDYLDVYMSHDGTEEVIENDTVIDFFQNLKKKGIIRATGISVYTLAQSLKAIEGGQWDVVQLAFNLMNQEQLPAIDLAAAKGVGIVVRSILFKGILTDKGAGLHPALNSVQEHRKKYNELLNGRINNLSALATKFVLSCEGVSSALVGIDKFEYLERALLTADGNHLDDGTLEKAKQLAYPDPEFLNLPVWERKGWLT
ncbi:MAG: aldo/keto reductase [Planctomycetaceae bacterium]|nr:aldo/keto reductase [Planctomycetaceae bacterium]